MRFAGGFGNDTIKGGPEDDLIESGPGADKLYGGDGADGLVGGLPGPTFLYGEGSGDLLAAGGGCAGGAIVGGPGKDDASFAETQAHPGLLIISFPKNAAWVDEIKGCDSVRLDDSNEDMEGSFDWDVLIGDGGPNAMLGQPGEDRFYGNGGDDIIDARDGVRDFSIQCGKGEPPKKIKVRGKGGKTETRETEGTGNPAGRAITDEFDPAPFNCAFVKHGEPSPRPPRLIPRAPRPAGPVSDTSLSPTGESPASSLPAGGTAAGGELPGVRPLSPYGRQRTNAAPALAAFRVGDAAAWRCFDASTRGAWLFAQLGGKGGRRRKAASPPLGRLRSRASATHLA